MPQAAPAMRAPVRRQRLRLMLSDFRGSAALAGYRRLVFKRPVGRAFHILVLAGLERPKECGEPNAAHKEGQRNEPCKCGHCANSSFAVRKRSAFTVTMMDEVDIAIAAINGVTIPAMASGMKSIL